MGSKIYGVDEITGTGGALDLGTSGRLAFGGDDYAKVSELGTPNDNSVTSAKIVDGNVTEAKLNSGIDAQTFDATFTPSYFTPVQVGSEGTGKISALLNGLDQHLSLMSVDYIAATSGEAISASDVCYMNDTDGKLYKATSASLGNLYVAASAATGADEVLYFAVEGILDGLNYETGQSFDSSKPFYVSSSEAGKITFTKPSQGNVVGYALDVADQFVLKSKSLAIGSVDTADIADDAVTIAKVSSGVETSLGKADTALQPTDLVGGDGIDYNSSTKTNKIVLANAPDSVVLVSTTGGFNGTYAQVNTGHISGSTFTLDSDTYLYAKANGANWDVLYSNDSTGWFVDTFDSDPSSWANSESLTRVGTSETIDTTGYVQDGDGIYVPSTSSSKVDSFVADPTSMLEFTSGKLGVRSEAVTVGSSTKVPTSSSVKTELDKAVHKDGSVAFTGDVDAGSNKLINVTDGTAASDGATKGQLDTAVAGMLKSDGSVAMTASFDAGSQKIINVAEPTLSSDAATKNYVDASTSGLGAFWTSAQLDGGASNLTLSGEQTLDGILTSASRVLVRGQTDASENGIYVTAAGSWSRATDADNDAEFKTNKTVFISEGIVCAGCVFAYTGDNDPVVGTDDLDFVLKQTAAAIADGSITTAKLADDAITNQKLASDSVDSDQVVDGSIDNIHISGVDAGKLTTGTLDDARVAESNVTQHEGALSLSTGQVTSGQFVDARISQSSVTQHQASLTLTESQISDLTKAFTQDSYASQANGTVTIKSSSSDMIWGVKVWVSTAYTTGTLTIGDSTDPDRLTNQSTVDLTSVGLSEFTVAHKYSATDIEGVFASMSGAGDVYVLLEHVAA